jgi:plastocyanin
MRRLATVAAAAVLVTGLAGCGDDDTPTAATDPTTTGRDAGVGAPAVPATGPEVLEPQVVEVAVPGGPDGEFAFETDLTTIEAGPMEVRLTNGGALEHQAAIFRFDDGEDFGTFAAAAATDGPQAALALVEGFGGPNAVAAGGSGSSTQVLVPGEYALLCVIPDAAGVPHAAQGMLRPFTVTEPATPPAEDALPLAAPDVEVDLVDLAFTTPTELAAGDTVQATNRGEQVHEIVTYRLADGETVADVVAAVAAGTPPEQPAGGLGLVYPGNSAQFALPEEPGDYVFLCFVPDATTEGGPPHLTRGMAAQLSIVDR